MVSQPDTEIAHFTTQNDAHQARGRDTLRPEQRTALSRPTATGRGGAASGPFVVRGEPIGSR
jgi:hypothetical protein